VDDGVFLSDMKNMIEEKRTDFVVLINRKFRVATEIGSTFFGCWSVTGQLKK
jgi:hypothetical protein